MSATTVRPAETNIPGTGKHTNGVLEQPLPVFKVPGRNNKTPSSSTYAASQAGVGEVDANQPIKPGTHPVAPLATDAEKPTTSKEERAAKRREEWSALEEGRKLKREAEQLKREASSFEQVKNSPQKLQALAKSLGMTSDELLTQLQNERMSIPTTKNLSPEEQYKQELAQRDAYLKAQNDAINSLTLTVAKDKHINKEILPHLVKDPDGFEFCHKYGIDRCASEVYDYCNKEFVKMRDANGIEYAKANKLSEVEVLKEFENALFEDWKANNESGKGMKKTSAYFNSQPSSAGQTLGSTPQIMREAKQEVTAAISQAMMDPAAKRVSKRAASTMPAGIDMNNLSNNNKLGGSINTTSNFDKAARKKRLLNGE